MKAFRTLALACTAYFGTIALSAWLTWVFNVGILGGFLVGACFGVIATNLAHFIIRKC